MEKKIKLEKLIKGDVIAIIYGFHYIKAIVIGNNGSHITWHSVNWNKNSSKVSPYTEMEEMGWTHIGELKHSLFFKKLELLYPSSD